MAIQGLVAILRSRAGDQQDGREGAGPLRQGQGSRQLQARGGIGVGDVLGLVGEGRLGRLGAAWSGGGDRRGAAHDQRRAGAALHPLAAQGLAVRREGPLEGRRRGPEREPDLAADDHDAGRQAPRILGRAVQSGRPVGLDVEDQGELAAAGGESAIPVAGHGSDLGRRYGRREQGGGDGRARQETHKENSPDWPGSLGAACAGCEGYRFSSAGSPPWAVMLTLIARSTAKRSRAWGPPALGPVPDRPSPPNGWTPTTAPVIERFT